MSTDLVTLDKAQFPALDPDNGALAMMQQNLGGEQLTASDFTRIKVPAGGGLTWTIPTVEGDESADVLEGVILHSTRRRAYWSNPNPTGDPPDCASSDCLRGVGSPGETCGQPGNIPCCQYNEFGSSTNGHGKACKEGRLLFLLRKGNILPDLIMAPPASLKAMRQYLTQLSGRSLPYWGVITALTLEKASNRDGIAYSRITTRMAGKLDDEGAAAVLNCMKQYETIFAGVQLNQDDTEPQEV